MRTRFLITIIALGLALLVAAVLGIGYASLRSDVRARQDRTARFCRQVIGEMEFYGEALVMSGSPETSRERLSSPERSVARGMLRDGYYYCLIDAGADRLQADKWVVRLGLRMGAPSVETTRQALDEAIERLAQHGY